MSCGFNRPLNLVCSCELIILILYVHYDELFVYMNDVRRVIPKLDSVWLVLCIRVIWPRK